ncbi:hypothetical protein MPTA5024_25940 [Microbispora sp. ATCC PTA-5024]|nr:hypothetical protein MPTA5024_25940 [Microbispora sp. ATCC PTA-5024]
MMLREARRFVMSLRARSALEFAGQRPRAAADQAHRQVLMSRDAVQAVTDRHRVTGAQEGPC